MRKQLTNNEAAWWRVLTCGGENGNAGVLTWPSRPCGSGQRVHVGHFLARPIDYIYFVDEWS